MMYKVVTISSKKLRVRKGMSINSDIVGHLYKNNIYDCVPINDEWAQVTSADTGAVGYVLLDYLEPCAPIINDITITFTRTELKSIIDYINGLLGE